MARKFSKSKIKAGATQALTLLNSAKAIVDKLLPISGPGMFLRDKHATGDSAKEAETAARHIALLQVHKPKLIAMEFFSIDQATFGRSEVFSKNLALKDDDNEPLTLEAYLELAASGDRLKDIQASTKDLHDYFRMEGKVDDLNVISRTLLWTGHLNSVAEQCNFIGLDIPKHPLFDLARLCGTNPIWAENLAWRVSCLKSRPGEFTPKWAMIAGAEHWEWTKGHCQCDLKNLLPCRLSAYALQQGISDY